MIRYFWSHISSSRTFTTLTFVSSANWAKLFLVAVTSESNNRTRAVLMGRSGKGMVIEH